MTHNLPSVPEHPQRVLLGILIDVSNSMRRNWRNDAGKQLLSRIEVVRDTLNRRIKAAQRKTSLDEPFAHIDLFCLGMGFKAPARYTSVLLSEELEHSLGEGTQEMDLVDLTCDLLALSEILPTQEELEDFKTRVNQKWMQYAKDILDQSVINEDIYADLVEYLQNTLRDSALQRFHRSLRYLYSYKFQKDHIYIINALTKEVNIKGRSVSLATEYVADIFRKSRDDFSWNRQKYIGIIQKHLQGFVELYIRSILRALTVGFGIVELCDDLDVTMIQRLAERIYADLHEEVRKQITATIYSLGKRLYFSGRQIGASFDRKTLQAKTELLITKTGWDFLRPLVEETVLNMFEREFERQAAESFPYWIRLASTREITRALSDLSVLLPEVVEEDMYSDKVMFGTTPFSQALDKAAVRFLDPVYQKHKKTLIIISDGEFDQENDEMVTVRLLKRRGVNIIACLISDRNILSRLVKHSEKDWQVGAKRMLEIASEVDESNITQLSEKKYFSQALTGKKLCYQVNHSDVLDALIEDVLETLDNPE